jgi:hypothetical protein
MCALVPTPLHSIVRGVWARYLSSIDYQQRCAVALFVARFSSAVHARSCSLLGPAVTLRYTDSADTVLSLLYQYHV